MVAGKRKEVVPVPPQPSQQYIAPNRKYNASFRNLPKAKLAGVIFGCKHETMKECLSKQLFGLPAAHFAYVQNIRPGFPLFLFNYSDRKLHGLFEAVCPGQLNLNRSAWTGGGSVPTPFPAQVCVRRTASCPPISESEFKKVIGDNYFQLGLFHFELDHAQVQGLTSLFRPAPVIPDMKAQKMKSVYVPRVRESLPAPQEASEINRFALLSVDELEECSHDSDNEKACDSRPSTSAHEEWETLDDAELVARMGRTANDTGFDADSAEDIEQNPFNKFSGEIASTHDITSDEDPPKSSSAVVNEYKFESVVKKLRDLSAMSSQLNDPKPQVVLSTATVSCNQRENKCSLIEEQKAECSEDIAEKDESEKCSHDLDNDKACDSRPSTSVHDEWETLDEAELVARIGQPANDPSFDADSAKDVEQFRSNKFLGKFDSTHKIASDEDASPKSSSAVVNESKLENIENKLTDLSAVSSQLNDPKPQVVLPTATGSCKQTDKKCLLTVEKAECSKGITEPGALKGNSNFDQSHDLGEVVRELAQKTGALEKKQAKSDRVIGILKQAVEDSAVKIKELESHVEELKLKPTSSLMFQDGTSHSDIDQRSIYLIGGYDGSAWLSTFDLYSPALDKLVPLSVNSSPRSYAASCVLRGEIIVLGGGGDGHSMCQTVECYSAKHNMWKTLPNLNHSRASLAGVTIDGKVFAIGGGDGTNYLSEVEMFDPFLGKWIAALPMLEKRFALAAAELNGVVYAAGGYDGDRYLQSCEWYDPREGAWAPLQDMKTPRGAHSLMAYDGLLYAIGGFDGSEMVSTVEAYDPRRGSWTASEPMSCVRGYAAAAVFDEKIYVFGGLMASDDILSDPVEVYSRSSGWSRLESSVLGRRSFHSAVVL